MTSSDLGALLGEHRREELLQLARVKLAEVRVQHRRLSDAHLTAKMAKERLESSMQRWVALRDRCRQAARTIDSVRMLPADAQALVLGTSGGTSDMDEQIRLLEQERKRLVQDEADQRAKSLGPVQERLRLAVAAQTTAQDKAARLQEQIAQLQALDTELQDINRQIVDANHQADAMAEEERTVQARDAACQRSIAELETQLTRLRGIHNDVQQHKERRVPDEDDCLSPDAPVPVSPVALNEAEERLREKSAALDAVRSECETLRARNTFLAEVEVEQKRLAETQATLAESVQLLATLNIQREYLDAKETEAIIAGSIASAEINLNELEASGRGMPTVAELQQSYIPALQRQVESLSEALSAANEDLFLLQDDGVVSRCTELQLAVASYHDETIPRLQATIQELRVARLDAKRAVAAWDEEEGPRHRLYLEQLAEDETALQAQLQVLQAEERRLTERVEAAAMEADSMERRRKEFAAEHLHWDTAGGRHGDPSDDGRRAAGDGQQRSKQGPEEGDEDEWVEILDACGRIRKRVRIPRPMRPTFFTPPPGDTAAVVVRSDNADASAPNGRRRAFSLREPVRSFFRSVVDLVRGKPIVIPGGGFSLTLEV